VPGRFDFETLFQELTGHEPFPWQVALYDCFVTQRLPKACEIPTGLGKTSVVAVWLLALARHVAGGTCSGFPRRLVYVVNRRTVVDQATREIEQMREALALPALSIVRHALDALAACPSEIPLGISTLRGQYADNGEWRNDPARAAVVVGTVDMIGSRLLFAGYRCGYKSRPLHAGFLGHDTLLVHDEAHLEPAFQELLEAVVREQRRSADHGKMQVLALSATTRSEMPTFGLTDADRKHPEVRRRITARKGIRLHVVDAADAVPEKVIELALAHQRSAAAVLVYLRRVEDAECVAAALRKAHPDGVATLTGTLRGLERDALARDNMVFRRFLPDGGSQADERTVFLVCTSAGEVGVNLSADHLVCDLTPFDSIAQRLGRVNRFGHGDATVDIVCPPARAVAKRTPFDTACERTSALLQKLPTRSDGRRDGSPAALATLPLDERHAAFSPKPGILPATDILFDAWSMTSIREPLPGRPAVAAWLHGVAEWEKPDAYVAWRTEVERITGELLDQYPPAELLEDYPLKAHEIVRDRVDRVFARLKKLADAHGDEPVWLLDEFGAVTVMTLTKVTGGREQRLQYQTVLLPPRLGGLDAGHFVGTAPFSPGAPYDVADRWFDETGAPWRTRLWDANDPPPGMRLVRTLDTRGTDVGLDAEEQAVGEPRYWCWFARTRAADDDGSRAAEVPQSLSDHAQRVEQFARALTARLGLDDTEATALRLAARWHDMGKHRALWQRSIGNTEYPAVVLAKSGGRVRLADLHDYRHELGSLHDLRASSDLAALAPDVQDLLFHLIATHHGRARPHFGATESFDPNTSDALAQSTAAECPARFMRLQRTYGRWGLAYLESLLRAADALASQEPVQGRDAMSSPLVKVRR